MAKKELMIKICGMRDIQNITELIKLPIQYIGHIFYEKSARYFDDINSISIPSHIKKTGVFVNSSIEEIKNKIEKHQLFAIQLHGSESVEFIEQLKLENIEIIKAFGVDDNFNWDILASYEGKVDYFLFDTKSPSHGGTGRTFDWEILNGYPYSTPYFLSGGLSLENLEEAIKIQDERFKGLDLNSKFEIEPGIKDIEKIKIALKIIENEQISSR